MSTRFLKANGLIDPRHMMHTLGIHSIHALDIHEPEAFRHTRLITAASEVHAVTLEFDPQGVKLVCRSADAKTLDRLGRAVRAWLDLDTNLSGMQTSFSTDPILGPLVAKRPWLRLVGYLNGFEAAATTILGQQVTLAAGRTFGARFVTAYGATGPEGLRVFPTPESVVEPGVEVLREAIGLTKTRAATLYLMAESFSKKSFSGNAEIPLARSELLDLRGVGPWTADYLQMRGHKDPDAFVPGDLVARRALNRISEREASDLAQAWAPYRSYAMVHLWASDKSFESPKS